MRVGHIAVTFFDHCPCLDYHFVVSSSTLPIVYASSFSTVFPCLGVCRWYFSLNAAEYSFCSFSISSNSRIMCWSVFFSFSLFGLHNRSFDPSVVNEPFASPLLSLAMDISFLDIIAFLGPNSLGLFLPA